MRSLVKLVACGFLVAQAVQPAGPRVVSAFPTFRIAGGDPAPWNRILSSVSLQDADILILEGASAEAEALGFHATGRKIRVASVEDLRSPELAIVWERAAELPVFDLPPEARVFMRARHTEAPLVAGFRRGNTAVLWVACPPGNEGYERFPYLLQALGDLGAEPELVSRRLWAFFDSSYRLRVDLDFFAARWRASGIGALQVAAWHFYEPSPDGDDYLRRLIEACHRHGIVVYAWLELPHVSDAFWDAHPEWREKTALLQDAQLDWRKLMNLTNRDCFRAAAKGVHRLVERFDWDGVNLAEMYFESLQGFANPSRFTPMNDDVRREFRQAQGFDPADLFHPVGQVPDLPRRPGGQVGDLPHTPSADRMRKFLDYRAQLAGRIESEWVNEIETARQAKPDLDLVLTYVDDRLDPGMRDAIGVDSSRLASLNRNFTLMIEDPATLWNLGPDRYGELAKHYRALQLPHEKIAVDINIVKRYQDVYPTRQQTGVEFFQLVHQASQAFERVALYFENSLVTQDLRLLPASAAVVNRWERSMEKLKVDSPHGFGVRWKGPARLDGQVWPAASDEILWVPAGAHEIEPSTERPNVRLLDFNGNLKSARTLPKGIEFEYQSSTKAIAVLDGKPRRLQIDGRASSVISNQSSVLTLPSGHHVVTVFTED